MPSLCQPVDLRVASMGTDIRIYDNTPCDLYFSSGNSAVCHVHNLHLCDNTLSGPSSGPAPGSPQFPGKDNIPVAHLWSTLPSMSPVVEESVYLTARNDTIGLPVLQKADHIMSDMSLSSPLSFSTNASNPHGTMVKHTFRATPSTANSLPSMPNVHCARIRIVKTRQVSKTAPYICQWRREDNSVCKDVISRATCAEHLVFTHGIRNKISSLKVKCYWCPDGAMPVKRESIVRHVREVHLRQKRSGVSASGGIAPY
ncbi:hypothetical protein BS17DRAFT_787723 [Gyrodon lividus]|nr:hypothetical protein BS17DRAFT_787723 [Gyrodon lividus]